MIYSCKAKIEKSELANEELMKLVENKKDEFWKHYL